MIKIIKKDVKNLTLKVKPNCEVILVAPLIASDSYIKKFLKDKSSWIEEKLDYFKSHQIPKRELVSGEDFYYLGKRYRLKVIEREKEGVKLEKEYCYLFVKGKDNLKRKERILEEWYRERAKEVFDEVIKKYQRVVKRDINRVTIRKMKTRWGSCSYHKKNINLNLELIKKPLECVEYVIFHELTHLIHPNHSKEFYNYLLTYMSDWKIRKEKLNRSNLL